MHRGERHVVRVGETRNACSNLVLGRPRRRVEDNIKMYFIHNRGQRTMGGPSSLELDKGTTAPHLRQISLLRNVTRGLGSGGLLWTR